MTDSSEFVVLGVLARVDDESRRSVESAVEQFEGVSLFAVGDSQKIGILIESRTLAEGEKILETQVKEIPGILGTWPVFVHCEPEEEASAEESNQSAEPSTVASACLTMGEVK